jgi:FKBP-type peptidyl-prolyl cis-trans isomerase FkpA
LHYIIKAPGSGDAFPSLASDITINYKGYLLDGTVFDENTNITFALNRLIRGWQQGIPLIKPGGEIMLLIPSELGYGANRSGSIPGNSVLIFEIDLISFVE